MSGRRPGLGPFRSQPLGTVIWRIIMVCIDFAQLRRLVDELESLENDVDEGATAPGLGRRLEDLQYSLCLWVGLKDPGQALDRARDLLVSSERNNPAGAA